MRGQNYEFSHRENSVVGRTALWATLLGVVLLVEAALKLLDIATNPLGTLVTIVVSGIIGASFVLGGTALKKVVSTEGDDIVHLLDALTQLTRAFTIRIVVMLIAAVFALFALFVFGAMAGF